MLEAMLMMSFMNIHHSVKMNDPQNVSLRYINAQTVVGNMHFATDCGCIYSCLYAEIEVVFAD